MSWSNEYAIRWAEEDAPCFHCGESTGRGPVGWHLPTETPVCDSCMCHQANPLAQVLLSINILREVAEAHPLRAVEKGALLITIADIYHAQQNWVLRSTEILSLVPDAKDLARQLVKAAWN